MVHCPASSWITHRVAESSQTGFVNTTVQLSELQWPPQAPDLNAVEHLWDVAEQEIGSMRSVADKSAAMMW